MKRFLVVLVCLMFVAAVGFIGCKKKEQQPKPVQKPVVTPVAPAPTPEPAPAPPPPPAPKKPSKPAKR